MNGFPPPERPLYTLFAGINGAGKTSLYSVLKSGTDLGERINIDEIAQGLGGWRDTLNQIKAGRTAIKKITDCIERGVSFHQETTLPGATVTKLIMSAREAGFYIRLYYVGIDDLETAIKRVHIRVKKGGHGIDDDVIRKRFEQMIPRLQEIIPLCDETVFYDNTVRFRQIAVIFGSSLIDCDRDLPNWFYSLMGEKGDGTVLSEFDIDADRFPL